jgi:hypothetical protein
MFTLQRHWYDESSWHTCWLVGPVGDYPNANLWCCWYDKGYYIEVLYSCVTILSFSHSDTSGLCYLADYSSPCKRGRPSYRWWKLGLPWGHWTTSILKVWFNLWIFCLWDPSLEEYLVTVVSFLQACSSAVISRQYCGKNERPRQNLQGNCDFD